MLVTIMTTEPTENKLTSTLFGKTRKGILSLVLGHPDESFYLRQIVRETGMGLGPVQRELAKLTDAGIVVRTTSGRQVYYRANSGSPAFRDLKALVSATSPPIVMASPLEKTAGDTSGAASRNISIPKKKLADFCQRNYIRRLSFFGSVLRHDFRPDSDIDVLVEFEPGKTPGFAFFGMQEELSEMLGRKVDLNTLGDLSPYFRSQVVNEAQGIYDAG